MDAFTGSLRGGAPRGGAPQSGSLRGSAPHPHISLQLVMHFCDLRTALALARCNHHALQAASCAFAWKTPGGESRCAIGLHDARAIKWVSPFSLAQFMRLRLVCRGLAPMQVPTIIPSLYELNLRDMGTSRQDVDDYCRLLARPMCSHVRILHISRPIEREGMQPRLSAQHFFASVAQALGKQFHALTSLHWMDHLYTEAATWIGRSCRRLQSLHIDRPYTDSLDAMVLSNPMEDLLSLTLDEYHPPSEDTASAFAFLARMPGLRELCIGKCFFTDRVVRGVSGALMQTSTVEIALRRITLTLSYPASLPSNEEIAMLMDRIPALQIKLNNTTNSVLQKHIVLLELLANNHPGRVIVE